MTQSSFNIASKKLNPAVWFLDSRASNHMANNSDLLTNVRKHDGALQIHTANVDHFPIENIGDIDHTLPSKISFLHPI